MQVLTQTLVLTRLAFLGIAQRKWSALVLVGSVACVIGVMLSMLSVTAGMLRAYRSGEDPQQAVVLAPENSGRPNAIPTNDMGTILDAPGIAKSANGHSLGDHQGSAVSFRSTRSHPGRGGRTRLSVTGRRCDPACRRSVLNRRIVHG